MKSLAIAAGALVVIIAVAFFLSKGDSFHNDTLIPSPSPIGSPGFEIINPPTATKSAVKKDTQTFPVLKANDIKGRKVRIATAKGDIVFELFEDTPLASSNFIYLAQNRFFNGLIFHRRVEGFVIQGGDPKGDGTGGPPYRFKDEPVNRDYTRGIVAMANAGPNTNGSQFFIMLADALTLPKSYTIFGNVVEGIEVVDKIQIGDKMEKVTIE